MRSPGITDLAGRSLPRDLVFRFTTSDATPPSLVKQHPAQGAGGLPVKTQVRLEFSEPVDPDSAADAENYRVAENRVSAVSLQPDQRLAFVLREYEHLSYAEIAEALGLSPGTVMSRLFRAREKLARALGPYLGPAGRRRAGGRP